VGYVEVILGHVEVGKRVAIVGAGGIGHDVAELLTDGAHGGNAEDFLRRWGVDSSISHAGGWSAPPAPAPAREIFMLQRSPGRLGARLGKSTGWILRTQLKRNGVRFLSGVTYRRVDDQGLHITTSEGNQLLSVDTVVICAGQEPDDQLALPLRQAAIPFDVIGGARLATELDAARAIEEGTQLAQRLGCGARETAQTG
jgi:2,4-dienoyl-CoA reductase (NADPH2)